MREHRTFGPPGGAGSVKDHRGVLFAEFGGLVRGNAIGEDGKLRRAGVVIDGNAMHQVGNVACIGQPVNQPGLMNQKPRAAVGQHIGNFRLLLSGAEDNSNQAQIRGAEQRQHKFDAVAK